MQYYNVLEDTHDFFGPIQHGRYTDLAEAEAHVARLRAQGIDAYVAPWREYA